MTKIPNTSWALIRVEPYRSLPGEGKLLRVDTDRKDLANRARPLNAQQRKAGYFKSWGYPKYKFKVVPVPQS